MISMVWLAVFLLFQLKIPLTQTRYNSQNSNSTCHEHVLDYMTNYESLLSTRPRKGTKAKDRDKDCTHKAKTKAFQMSLRTGQGQGQGLISLPVINFKELL